MARRVDFPKAVPSYLPTYHRRKEAPNGFCSEKRRAVSRASLASFACLVARAGDKWVERCRQPDGRMGGWMDR